ncbi:hypothetical protein [Actinophytocola glycyrrhizae]|uniref:WXG100 family type VII secretion target n=1 Tax=Actinophytocola glycyrrhizae TaxID=2044873 RepID=A0ABV9S9B1_9PSEU
MGDVIGKVLSKAGIDEAVGDFFNLMPQVDLDEIRRVGKEVWGTDLEAPGAITDALDQTARDLPRIVDDLGEGWRDSDAFARFKKHIDIDTPLYAKAAKTAQNVGQALVDFADAADSTLADKLAAIVGGLGALVGAGLGLLLGPPGAAAGAGVGALVGLVVGIAFAYFGVLLPKVASALQTLDDLGDQFPPDHDA